MYLAGMKCFLFVGGWAVRIIGLVVDVESSWRSGPRAWVRFQERCGFGSHSPGEGTPGALEFLSVPLS